MHGFRVFLVSVGGIVAAAISLAVVVGILEETVIIPVDEFESYEDAGAPAYLPASAHRLQVVIDTDDDSRWYKFRFDASLPMEIRAQEQPTTFTEPRGFGTVVTKRNWWPESFLRKRLSEPEAADVFYSWCRIESCGSIAYLVEVYLDPVQELGFAWLHPVYDVSCKDGEQDGTEVDAKRCQSSWRRTQKKWQEQEEGARLTCPRIFGALET